MTGSEPPSSSSAAAAASASSSSSSSPAASSAGSGGLKELEEIPLCALRHRHDPASSLSKQVGNLFWTSNPSSEIRAFDAKTGEEKEKYEISGTPTCLAVAHQGKALLIGMESGKVELNELPDCTFEDFLTRCTSPIRDLAYSKSDRLVAVASEDLELRLIEPDSRNSSLLRKHDGGVQSVCFDPKEEFLASIGIDGQLVIWNLATRQSVFTKKVTERETKGNCWHQIYRAVWKPDGSILVVPGSRRPIFMERSTWKVISTPNASSIHTADIGIITWSEDGNQMATVGHDKRVVIWSAGSGASVSNMRAGQAFMSQELIRDISWCSTGGAIAVMDVNGNFGIQKVAVTSFSAGPPTVTPSKTDKNKTKSNENHRGQAEGDVPEATKGGKSRFLDDEASSVEGNGGEGDKKQPDEGGDEDEEGLPLAEEEEDDQLDEENADVRDAAVMQLSCPLQGPFLPSSSPLDATKRYLVWNTIGNIVSQNIGDHNVIEIEFADASRRPIRFTDHYRFIMGSIAEDGAMFANAAFAAEGGDMDQRGEPSTIFFRPFANYSQKSQWLYTLREGEGALSVAVGARWAAVATTKGWIRLFTFSGLQDDCLSLQGEIVTMVGRGDLLAIFYHESNPVKECQCIHYELLDVQRRTRVASGPVRISPKALLTWAGFSDLDMLYIMDSEGVVSMLAKGYGWRWMPVLETKAQQRNKLDSFWPVGIHGGQLMYTLLKGGDEHPHTNPKPLVSSLPLKMPLISHDHELVKLEEVRLLARAFLEEKAHKQEILVSEGLEPEPMMEEDLMRGQASYDTNVVKMIQMAAKSENGERMVELSEMLHLEKSLDLAIRIANHYSLPNVAKGISSIQAARMPPAMEAEMYPPSPPASKYDRQSMAQSEASPPPSPAEAQDENDGEEEMEALATRQIARPSLGGGGAANGKGKGAREGITGKEVGGGGGGGPARNPFAVKKDQGTGAEKRPRSIAESLGSLIGSPSPKRPVLQKTSSFANEMRTKKKHDRRA